MTTTAPATGISHIGARRAGEPSEILDLAHNCRELFVKCTSAHSVLSETHEKIDLQQQRFYVWESYLGVFAPFNASLDKCLQYSDEPRSLVLQMLSVLQRNLEFRKLLFIVILLNKRLQKTCC